MTKCGTQENVKFVNIPIYNKRYDKNSSFLCTTY